MHVTLIQTSRGGCHGLGSNISYLHAQSCLDRVPYKFKLLPASNTRLKREAADESVGKRRTVDVGTESIIHVQLFNYTNIRQCSNNLDNNRIIDGTVENVTY